MESGLTSFFNGGPHNQKFIWVRAALFVLLTTAIKCSMLANPDLTLGTINSMAVITRQVIYI
jgi:hypothetical protein